jgi:choline kinase
VKAIILAANDNLQLRPMNLGKPSTLIKINGISLLEHQIRGVPSCRRRNGFHIGRHWLSTGQVKRYLMHKHPEIHLVRDSDYRSAGVLHSLNLALRRAAPHTSDEALFISSGACAYDDAVIERVSRVSGSAIAVDSSCYEAVSTKVIAEDGNVVSISTDIPNHAATAVITGLCKLDAHARTVLSDIAAEHLAEKKDAPMVDTDLRLTWYAHSGVAHLIITIRLPRLSINYTHE